MSMQTFGMLLSAFEEKKCVVDATRPPNCWFSVPSRATGPGLSPLPDSEFECKFGFNDSVRCYRYR